MTSLAKRWGGRRTPELMVGLIAFGMLPVAVQASFFPQSFYDDFPLGRAWIAADGAYNEHLVRDVGGLFAALIVATAVVLVRRLPVTPVAVAWLVQGVLHLWYHVGHLDAFDGVDRAGLIGSLVFVPVLAAAALVMERRQGASIKASSSA